jgi:adenine/guanine/hypoxanthine permease
MNLADYGLPALAVIVALGNGFIITATIWAAFVVELTEHRLRAAALVLLSMQRRR